MIQLNAGIAGSGENEVIYYVIAFVLWPVLGAFVLAFSMEEERMEYLRSEREKADAAGKQRQAIVAVFVMYIWPIVLTCWVAYWVWQWWRQRHE